MERTSKIAQKILSQVANKNSWKKERSALTKDWLNLRKIWLWSEWSPGQIIDSGHDERYAKAKKQNIYLEAAIAVYAGGWYWQRWVNSKKLTLQSVSEDRDRSSHKMIPDYLHYLTILHFYFRSS